VPTVIRSFPQTNRSGTQQTPYVQLPAGIEELHLQGQASAATLADPLNTIIFSVLVSRTGLDADAHEIQGETWTGGTYTPKGGGADLTKAIDVTFGPIDQFAGQFIAIRAIFNRTINVGATLTSLP
jgi:hypothetical protein